MVRFAIFSKHVIFPESLIPMWGVIFISDELIENVYYPDSSTDLSIIRANFPLWDILDYSEFYISPGVIDLNTRIEWEEGRASFSKAAISGGVTFALYEPSFYTAASSDSEELFMDIGSTYFLNDTTASNDFSGCFALKAYLSPPCSRTESLKHLSLLSSVSKASGLAIFVDPNCPDSRTLFLSSPNRFETSHKASDKKAFGGAYGELISENSSDSECDLKHVQSLMQDEMESLNDSEEETQIYYGGDEIISVTESAGELSPHKAKPRRFSTYSNTIFDEVDKRIQARKDSIEVLCEVETKSYMFSGSTKYEANKPQEVSTQSVKTPSKRPLKIITKAEDEDRVFEYSYYLASCPEFWETKGIEIAVKAIDPSCRLHFQNISSATAISKIRQYSGVFRSITCELAASQLFFRSSDVKNKDTRFKSKPPIRNEGNFNLLWDLVHLSAVNVISSHHVCIAEQFKAFDSGDFQKSLSGICSIGMSLQAVWTSVNKEISGAEKLENYLVRMAKWMSLQPSKIIGYKMRGSISKGKYADLVVWDPYTKKTVRNEKPFLRVSPFEGYEMLGSVAHVYLRGKLAFSENQYFAHGRHFYNN